MDELEEIDNIDEISKQRKELESSMAQNITELENESDIIEDEQPAGKVVSETKINPTKSRVKKTATTVREKKVIEKDIPTSVKKGKKKIAETLELETSPEKEKEIKFGDVSDDESLVDFNDFEDEDEIIDERSNLEVFEDLREKNKGKNTKVILESEDDIEQEIVEESEHVKEKVNKDSNIFKEKVFLSSENPFNEKLKNFNPNIEEIVVKDAGSGVSKEIYNKYFNIKESPVLMPRVTRIPLLLSGYIAEMRAYNSNDHLAVERALSKNESYSLRLLKETQSLHEHISWDSEGYYKSYDLWAKNTYVEDLDMFYFGAKDATYVGEREYRLICGCGHNFTKNIDNKELPVIIQRGITPTEIKTILKNKASGKMLKELPIHKEAKSTIKKLLPVNKYLCELGLCSVRDFIEWVGVLEETFADTFDDLSIIEDSTARGHIFTKTFTYIRNLALPVPVANGKVGYRGISTVCDDDNQRINNKRIVANFLAAINKDSFKELIQGKDVRAMWSIRGIRHRIHDIECPACKTKIDIPLDMKERFFFEAKQSTDILNLRG